MTIRYYDYFSEFCEITLTGSSNSVRKFEGKNDLSESLDLKESIDGSRFRHLCGYSLKTNSFSPESF